MRHIARHTVLVKGSIGFVLLRLYLSKNRFDMVIEFLKCTVKFFLKFVAQSVDFMKLTLVCRLFKGGN